MILIIECCVTYSGVHSLLSFSPDIRDPIISDGNPFFPLVLTRFSGSLVLRAMTGRSIAMQILKSEQRGEMDRCCSGEFSPPSFPHHPHTR